MSSQTSRNEDLLNYAKYSLFVEIESTASPQFFSSRGPSKLTPRMLSRHCTLILLIAASLSLSLVASQSCNTSDCPTIPKHYEELACKGIKKKGECCSSSFDCPNLIDRDNSKCYYRDKTLLPGEVLENFQQSDTCEGKCYCNLNRAGGPSEIFCNRLKCSDKRPANQKTQKCVQQYENGNCCPVNAVCDDDINELATCEFEGKTYREGERMFPKKYCYKCFCGKNFNSQTPVPENRNCFKIDCGIALTKTRRLSEGCIPVYIKTDDCCPIGWRCPGDKHMSEPAKLDLSLDKCRFGNMMLKVGEALDLGGDNCQNCTCTMPPMLHCIQTC